MSKRYWDETLLKSNTANGKDWLQKYLHPPGTKGQSYNGYPDKSTTPCVHAEYRLQAELYRPASNLGSFPPNTMGVLTGPGILYPAFFANNLSEDNPDWRAVYTNTQLSLEDMASNFGRVRQAYNSVTAQLDATAFTNAGMIYHAQFYPSTYQIDTTAIADKLKDGTIKSRSLHHALGLNRKKTDGFDMCDADPRALNVNVKRLQVVKLGKPILSPTDITMLSPKSYTARATEGLFSVYQCSQDTNQFKAVGQYNYTSGTDGTRPMLCCYEIKLGGNTYLEVFNTSDGAAYVYDAEWSDWSWSYTYYVGLSPASGGSNQAYINFKHVMGIEVAPISRSILNSQTMPAALYDPTALDTAAIITQSRADGMPSEYNALGLASVAGSILPGLAKSVGEAISGADGDKKEKEKITETIEKAEQVGENVEKAAMTNTAAEAEKKKPQIRRPKKRNNRNRPRKNNKLDNMERELMRLRITCANMQSSPVYSAQRYGFAPARQRSRSNSRTRAPPRRRSNSRPRTVGFMSQ